MFLLLQIVVQAEVVYEQRTERSEDTAIEFMHTP